MKPVDAKHVCQDLNTATARYLAAERDKNILWFEMHPLIERFAFSVTRNMLTQRGTFRRPDEISNIATEIADYIVRRYLEDEHFMIKLYGPYIRMRVLACIGSSVGALSFSEVSADYEVGGLPETAETLVSVKVPKATGADPYLTPRSRREIQVEQSRRRHAIKKVGGQASSSGAVWAGYPLVLEPIERRPGEAIVESRAEIPIGGHWKQGELEFALCS